MKHRVHLVGNGDPSSCCRLLKKAELQLSTLRQSLEQLKQKADGLAEKVAANTQELEEGRCRREELLTEVQQLSRSKVVQVKGSAKLRWDWSSTVVLGVGLTEN